MEKLLPYLNLINSENQVSLDKIKYKVSSTKVASIDISLEQL